MRRYRMGPVAVASAPLPELPCGMHARTLSETIWAAAAPKAVSDA